MVDTLNLSLAINQNIILEYLLLLKLLVGNVGSHFLNMDNAFIVKNAIITKFIRWEDIKIHTNKLAKFFQIGFNLILASVKFAIIIFLSTDQFESTR